MKQWVLGLLLTAFVVRALIPVGFMPDTSAAANGVFKVVICSALGAKTLTLDDSGKPVPAQGEHDHDQPCAFAGLSFVALALPEVTGLILPMPEQEIALAPLAVQLPPARAGPQLGSRGPPLYS